MKRKLGFARNEHGKTVSVESLKGAKAGKYFCPNCGNEVVPKMGKEKVWHFSHKGKDCPIIYRPTVIEDDAYQDKSLADFSDRQIAMEDFDITWDPNIITCLICKTSTNRILAVDLGKGRFVCKGCFKGFDLSKLEQLEK